MRTRLGKFSTALVVFCVLFVYGLYSTIRSILLQPISNDFAVSYTGSGLMFLVSFLSIMLVNLAAGRLTQRFGILLLYLLSVVGAVFSMYFQALVYSYLLFVFFSFVMTVFTSGQNLFGNSLIASAFAGDGGSKLNLMHVFYGLGSLFAPIFLFLLGYRDSGFELLFSSLPDYFNYGFDFSWRLSFRILGILFGLVLIWIPFYRLKVNRGMVLTQGGGRFREALKDRHLLKLSLAVLFAAGYEVSVSSWLVYTLTESLGKGTSFTSLAIGLFFVGLALGRFLGSLYAKGQRLIEFLLPLSIFQAILALISLIFLPDLPLLFSFAGLTSSVFFPTLFYRVSQECLSPLAGAVYLSGAGIGLSLFPFLVGVLGDLISIRWALAGGVICALLLVPSIWSLRRIKRLEHV